MDDLPKNLQPTTGFKILNENETTNENENTPQNSALKNPAPTPVGLLDPEDQKKLDVLMDPKHASALELLLEANRKDNPVQGEDLIPTSVREEHLIAYLETQYWLNGGYPLFEDLLAETGFEESQMRRYLSTVSNVLTQRGLPSYALPPGPEDSIFTEWKSKFDPRFVLAAGFIANVSDKRNISAKLAEIDVTPAEWDGWLTNESYYNYFKLLVDQKWTQLDEVAKLGIIRGVHMGDLKTIQYFHEFTGKHVQKSEVAINVNAVLNSVIDILSHHVEPDVLVAVANELTGRELNP